MTNERSLVQHDVLAIVGSQHLYGHANELRARQIIEGVLDRQRPDVVISGGAIGVDSLADIIAFERGILFREFPPENRRWAPNGYKARNMQIAQACTRMLCIRSKRSTTYGSGWTCDRAEELGRTVWRVEL